MRIGLVVVRKLAGQKIRGTRAWLLSVCEEERRPAWLPSAAYFVSFSYESHAVSVRLHLLSKEWAVPARELAFRLWKGALKAAEARKFGWGVHRNAARMTDESVVSHSRRKPTQKCRLSSWLSRELCQDLIHEQTRRRAHKSVHASKTAACRFMLTKRVSGGFELYLWGTFFTVF